MVKMTREHQYSLVPEGVCRATVLNEMTIVGKKDGFDCVFSLKTWFLLPILMYRKDPMVQV